MNFSTVPLNNTIDDSRFNNLKKRFSAPSRPEKKFGVDRSFGNVKTVYKNAADPEKQLKESARELVSFFVQQMMKEMRKSLNKKEDMFYGGFAEDVYTEMLDAEYSKLMVKNSRFPLVDQIYNQLSRGSAHKSESHSEFVR